MKKSLILLPLVLSAAPAFAQQAPSPFQLPRELTDPATQVKLARTVESLSDAVMNVRIGDLSAALEGREATPRERNLTVRDLVHRKNPNFERDVAREVATAGPKVQRSMQALNRARPQIATDVAQMQKSFERALANLPDPTYPVR